ncbi:alanine/ornithine racemase family PLP-dependent enzyme [Desulfovibrio gilichinskyi]|uniref:Predicted amino acid racemase n=1 Tax=Desulfovibrio gilichinskyi TaxID=1519643 RepID=A0A1X7DFG5_9BACT|nr:alanine/ornithine racemase family PLP-dependent enzyme [Desulfovibrio gilichinskyi]SMF14521.1 Predicted amino acid racemase [Desulfovibrio gilichinskyi]
MNTPYLEIDLAKVFSNTQKLVKMFGDRNIDITGITKVALGEPKIANCLIAAGITSIGDSRISNIKRMHQAGVKAAFTLIRTPSMTEIYDVVKYADVSFNSELSIIAELSDAAIKQNKIRDIVLMVEMGDLREGILEQDLNQAIEKVIPLKGVNLIGLATNLACFSGVKPSKAKMDQLSRLAEECEKEFSIKFRIVSGGNSANFNWLFENTDLGRINNVRLGESIFIGRETLSRKHIKGLYLNAITLVAGVIESKVKPSLPDGEVGQDSFGNTTTFVDKGNIVRTILAIGKQDVHISGLTPLSDVDIIGSSSDHLILDTTRSPLHTGEQVRFSLDYAALLSCMTSPFVGNSYI